MRILLQILCVLSCVAVHASSMAQQVTLPQEKDAIRFAIIGDSGTGNAQQYETARRLAQAHDKFPFEFVLMMGDNIYGRKRPEDFQHKFELPYKPLLDKGVSFYACLGNHDESEEEYYKPFNMNGHRYYSFTRGDVRFFALDSNYLDPEQLTWLTRELQNAPEKWKIVFFHHPLYSSAATHGSSKELRDILEPLFQKYGVQIVLSGHDHVYERSLPQKGISYFTEGASGHVRRGDVRGAVFTAKSFDSDLSFLLAEVSGDDLFFQTVSRTGETVDSGTLARNKSATENRPSGGPGRPAAAIGK